MIKLLASVFLITGFIACGEAEAVDKLRYVFRHKHCIYNGEGGYYCRVDLGRKSYCYEVDGPHAISIGCDIYEESKRL